MPKIYLLKVNYSLFLYPLIKIASRKGHIQPGSRNIAIKEKIKKSLKLLEQKNNN